MLLLMAIQFMFCKEITDGDVNENDKRSRGLSQDDEEEDDEDEDIPGERFLPVTSSVLYSRLLYLSTRAVIGQFSGPYSPVRSAKI